MDRLNQRKAGDSPEKGRKSFEKPRLQAYDQGSFRSKTAQISQQGLGASPIKPMGLQFGGS